MRFWIWIFDKYNYHFGQIQFSILTNTKFGLDKYNCSHLGESNFKNCGSNIHGSADCPLKIVVPGEKCFWCFCWGCSVEDYFYIAFALCTSMTHFTPQFLNFVFLTHLPCGFTWTNSFVVSVLILVFILILVNPASAVSRFMLFASLAHFTPPFGLEVQCWSNVHVCEVRLGK